VGPLTRLPFTSRCLVGGVRIQTYTAVGRECGVQILLQSFVEAGGLTLARARWAASRSWTVANLSRTSWVHHEKPFVWHSDVRSERNVMAPAVSLMGLGVMGDMSPMALTGLRPHAARQSHQRVRLGDLATLMMMLFNCSCRNKKKMWSAVGKLFIDNKTII